MAAIYECGEELVPGYRVVKCLGRGGFGTVYKALGPGGFYVALKVINLFGTNEGRKELRALNLIKNVAHANLVRIMGAWVKDRSGVVLDDLERVAVGAQTSRSAPRSTLADTAVFSQQQFRPSELIICMTLGDRSLHDCLELRQRQGQMGVPADELFDYMEGAARGIDFLNREIHDLGDGRSVAIQHCDIKPMNILIVGGDSVQVCDFGMAKVVGDLRQSTGGAPLYMAPEVIETREPSRSTDQYSLAITFYELRTGGWPFDQQTQESREGILQAHLHGKLDFSLLEPGERKVIAKATARDPAARFSSCLEMVRALREGNSQSSRTSVPAPQPTSTGREEVGEQFVPGYWLVERIDGGDNDRVWRATFNEDSGAALLVRDLPPTRNAFDRNALKLVLNRRSGYQLTVPNQYWLLGADGHEVRRSGSQRSSDGLTSDLPEVLPTKLVVAGSLGDGTLQDRLRAGQRPIAPEVLLPWMEQIARALDHLNSPRHQFGSRRVTLLHCNIRPASILCVEDGSDVLLGNFTRARILEDAGDLRDVGHDFPGPYAAPELRDGQLERTSDQYSLAVTYLQLRTGQVTLDPALTSYELLDFAHDFITPAESDVLARALAFDPQERYPQCAGLVYALQAVLFPPVERPQPVEPSDSARLSKHKETARGSDTPPEFGTASRDEILPISTSQPLAAGDQPIRGFRLVRLLGEGGFGEVWKATAPGGTEVALKFIKLDGRKGIKEFGSLRLVKLVRHPNLVPIVAYWLTDQRGVVLEGSADMEDEILSSGSHSEVEQTLEVNTRSSQQQLPSRLIIAMGLGDRSLFDRLDECRDAGKIGIPREELMRYMDGAAQAIDFLNSPQHDLGTGPVAIQHCDIKPHNLLMVGGAVQVCDFGLARSLTNSRVTADATCSAPYAPPEIWRGENPHPQTDQYSLAITYFELRTGELPFPSENHAMIMYSHLEGKLDLSKLPEKERPIIARATALLPEDRYENCQALVAALHEVYQPKVKAKASGKWLALAAAMLLVAAGIGAYVLLPRYAPPDPAIAALVEKREFEQAFDIADAASGWLRPTRRKQVEEAWIDYIGQLLREGKFDQTAQQCNNIQVKFTGSIAPALAHIKEEWTRLAQTANQQAKQRLNEADGPELASRALTISETATAVQLFSTDTELQTQYKIASTLDPWRRRVREAEDLLAEKSGTPENRAALYQGAYDSFQTIPQDKLPAELRVRVVFGLARAAARLGLWEELGRYLQDSQLSADSLGIGERKSIVVSVHAIANAARIPSDLDAAEKLTRLIDCLPGEALTGLTTSDWEWQRIGSLREQAVNEFLAIAKRSHEGPVDQRIARLTQELALLQQVKQIAPPGQASSLNIQQERLTEIRAAYEELQAALAPGSADRPDPDPRVVAVRKLQSRITDEELDWGYICGELIQRARGNAAADPQFFNAVAGLLSDARRLYPNIETGQGLLHEKLVRLIGQSDEKAGQTALASSCQQAIEAGIDDPLVRCCWAECLLEDWASSSTGQPLTARVKLALDALPPQAPAEFEQYWNYVSARAKSLDGSDLRRDWMAISGHLNSFTAAQQGQSSLTAAREDKLGKLFYTAVKGAYFPPSKTPASIEAAIVDPYGLSSTPAAADTAATWLVFASQLTSKDRMADFDALSVLAAAARNNADGAADVSDALANLPVTLDARTLDYKHIAIRSAHARSQGSSPAGKQSALQLRAKLARDLTSPAVTKEQDQVATYERVFQEGIEFGRALYRTAPNDELAAALAGLLDAKGQFLWERRLADAWKFNVFDEIAGAYDQAIKLAELHPAALNGEAPTYIFRWGRARLSAPGAHALAAADLEIIIERANRAIEIHRQKAGPDGGFPLANGIIGRARRLIANYELNLSKRQGLLVQVVNELASAVNTPIPEDNEDTAFNLMNLVQARIDLVHILPFDVEQHSRQLHQAVIEAKRAVACPTAYPEIAFQSLGNAHEDLAWFVGFVKPEEAVNYDEAIKAFGDAYEQSVGDRSLPLCGRARCYYKRYNFGPRPQATDLENAAREFEVAYQLAGPGSSEAAFWLVQMQAGRNDFATAETNLARLREMALPEHVATYWQYWANLPMRKSATAEGAKQSRERLQGLEAHPRLPGSFDDPRRLAADVDGLACMLEGNWSKAFDAYSRVLSRNGAPIPYSDLDFSACAVLKSRAKLLLLNYPGRPQNWAAIAKADAERLLQLQPYPWEQAAALALLGDISVQSNQKPQAKGYFEKFIELTPTRADGTYANTEFPGWQIRFGLLRIVYDEALAARQTNQPLETQRGLYTKAKALCDEIINNNAIPLGPQTERPRTQLRTMKTTLDTFAAGLNSPAPRPQSPTSTGKKS